MTSSLLSSSSRLGRAGMSIANIRCATRHTLHSLLALIGIRLRRRLRTTMRDLLTRLQRYARSREQAQHCGQVVHRSRRRRRPPSTLHRPHSTQDYPQFFARIHQEHQQTGVYPVLGSETGEYPQCAAEIPRQARDDRKHSSIVILSLPKDLRPDYPAENGESPYTPHP
jgi:hypothetical protein